jgi:hypothetical protein
VRTLESLFADAPQEARGDAALWYAQALAEVDEARALEAFARARQVHETTETLAAYGLYLARLGRDAEAREVLERVLHNARVGSATSRELNREAIDRARAALRTIEARGG